MHRLTNSFEAERAVLGAIFLKPDLIDGSTGELRAEHFFFDQHRKLWNAFKHLAENKISIDLRTVQARLEERGELEAVGGVAYMAGLDLDLPDLGAIEDYIAILKDRFIRRSLLLEVRKLLGTAGDRAVEVDNLLTSLSTLTTQLENEQYARGGLRHISESLEEMDLEPKGQLLGFSTGLTDLDKYVVGLQSKRLYVFAGRPGHGKTSLALNIALHIARPGQKVAFFSLEMPAADLIHRLLAIHSNVPHQSIARGLLGKEELQRSIRSFKELSESGFHLDDYAGHTIDQVSSMVRQQKRQRGLDVVFIDYLNLMGSAKKFETRNLEVGSFTRRLKLLAKELSIPIVVLVQLSREPERRKNKRPQLADLRESGNIEQDADLVCFIYREELYEPADPEVRNVAELIIAKNRYGAAGVTVRVHFNGELTRFSNLYRGLP